MARKAKRERLPFEVGDAVNFEHVRAAAKPPEESAPPPKREREIWPKGKRKPKVHKKRSRNDSQKNFSVDKLTLIEEILQTEAFFDLVEHFKLPSGTRGPKRQYSEISVALWTMLIEEYDSVHALAAAFRHRLVDDLVATTLEKAWPGHPERRVPAGRPMSRSQFSRHRQKLEEHNPGAAEQAIATFTTNAIAQALAMGYFPKDDGSLGNPKQQSVVCGDGTVIAAATDYMEGDRVTYEVEADQVPDDAEVIDVTEDGKVIVAQQARYDDTAVLNGKDETRKPYPASTYSHLQAQNGEEQERIILAFSRADELGEARTLEQMLEPLQAQIPHLRHYGYDMAVQGATIERLYKRGLHPIVKVTRNNRNEPASALIETRVVAGASGREHTIQIWALDGVAGVHVVANGEKYFVKLTPKIPRQPRIGTHQGFYEFPDHALIGADLRGQEIMVRLDGRTDDGRHRAQYLRWFNEHSERGRNLLGLREGTESENVPLKNALPWGRARSFGEFRITLDVLGYYFGRNVRAALAHERRTGINPLRSGSPPEVPAAAAA